jgi:hypothetical protein
LGVDTDGPGFSEMTVGDFFLGDNDGSLAGAPVSSKSLTPPTCNLHTNKTCIFL